MNSVTSYNPKSFRDGRTIPYAVCFYTVSENLGNCDRALINEWIEICKNDTVVLEDDDCITQLYEDQKKFESEPEWLKLQSTPMNGDYQQRPFAHNGSRFNEKSNLTNRLT